MLRNRKRSRNQTLITTLLLFAGLLTVTGVLSMLPRETKNVEEQKTESAAEEVFLEIQIQEDAVSVFRSFAPPLQGIVTSAYGYRQDPFSGNVSFHKGVDIAVPEGTEVAAAENGTVKRAAYNGIGGNFIIVSHENGTESYYGHLQTRIVSEGDLVAKGDIIGLSGKTGRVTGPHLHFQLTYHDRTVDPQRYLNLSR